jgi:hypothetical protein
MMKRVAREVYADVVKRLPHDWANPIEGDHMSMMQYAAPDGEVIAQATYHKGMIVPQYYVKEELT